MHGRGTRVLFFALALYGTSLLAQHQSGLLVRRLLDDPSYKVRAQAAIVLAQHPAPGAVQALIKALGDPYAAVRATAAITLGKLGDPVARSPLVKAAEDPEPLVRGAAVRALKLLGERRSPPGAGEQEGFAASGPGLVSKRSREEQERIRSELDKSFRRCGLRQLKRDPDFQGATLQFSILPEGRISRLEISEPSMEEGRFRQCVRKALDSLDLGPAGGGDLRMTWPLRISR